jgi:hypothetical protein
MDASEKRGLSGWRSMQGNASQPVIEIRNPPDVSIR